MPNKNTFRGKPHASNSYALEKSNFDPLTEKLIDDHPNKDED